MLTFGMGALGALLGLLIAWSASPIVATLLPLLFGVVGGASGFSLLKMDLSKPGSQQKLKTTGAALLSCCLACIATLVIGVATKGLFIAWQTSSLVYQLSPDELSRRSTAIDRLLLRKRLTAIGATRSEVKAIMETSPKDSDLKAVADEIYKAANELLAAYDELSPEEKGQVASDQSKFSQLLGAARIFSILKVTMDNNGQMTPEGFRFLTNGLYAVNFNAVIPNDSDSKQFVNHPKLPAAIAKLLNALEKNDTVADPASQSNKIDEFLKIIAVAKPSSDIPLVANYFRPDDLM